MKKWSAFRIKAALPVWAIRLFLLFWSLLTVYPLVWTAYSSLKSNKEFMSSPWALPKVLQWSNYVYAWQTSNMAGYFLNSLMLVALTLAIMLVMTTTNAYIIAKFKGRVIALVQKFYIVFMMVPQVLLLVPLYFMCMDLKLDDNLFILALLYALQGLPFSIFMLVPFFKGINDSLLEAARIDGANQFRIFAALILPMAKPAIFIAGLLNIVGTWNEFAMALTFIRDSAKYTVPIGISYLSSSSTYNTQYGGLFAGLILALIPILIIYAIFQKPLQSGLSSTDGVKG